MSANCNYSEKFRPLVMQKFPPLKEGTFVHKVGVKDPKLLEVLTELFKNPIEAYDEIVKGIKPFEEPPVETQDVDQRLNVLQNAKQGSIGTFYIANTNELAAVQRKFKRRLVECSIFSIDYTQSVPTWNWETNPNDPIIGDISKLNKNIIDYKLELINKIRRALNSPTLPEVNFNSAWTDTDFQKLVDTTLKAFEKLKTDDSLNDDSFQELYNAYAVLVNFDEFIEEQVPFVSVKKAYKKLEGLNKYDYRGPNVENYTGFQSGEFAAIESQDSDLAKIILEMIPECDAQTGEILENTSCGLAGFNSGMTVIKRNLLYKTEDIEARQSYFDDGLDFNLQSFLEDFLAASINGEENVSSAYDPNRTYLLNKLKGISKFLLDQSTPIAVKNMFLQMFFKTEAISYRAYTRTDNDFGGKNLKSRFIDTQRKVVEGFIENGIRQFSKPIIQKSLDRFDLTDNKNGTYTLKDSVGISVTFGVTLDTNGYNSIIDNQGINPNIIHDLIQTVLQQIVPSDYETCIKHDNNWTFANDYLPLVALVLNQTFNHGTIEVNDDGKRNYKTINKFTVPVAKRLSIVYGSETKNVVNSPSGKKLPIYQLTCLAYNVQSLVNDYSKIDLTENAYTSNLLVSHPRLLGSPMVRNEVMINGQSKEPSKLTVSELSQLAILEDFYKELISSGTIYLQNATFADKGTHFLQEYNLKEAEINGKSLHDMVMDCVNGVAGSEDVLVDIIRATRAEKVNTVVANIINDYNKVFRKNFTSIDEVNKFIKNKKLSDITEEFNNYNKSHKDDQVVFYEEIHSSGKSPAINEMILNHYRTFNDPNLTKQRFQKNLNKFAQTIYEEGFELNGFSNKAVEEIVRRYSKASGINDKFYNSITKRLKLVVKNGDSYEIHPILKAFFYSDILLSNEYNSLAIGEAWCHPNKNKDKGKSIEDWIEYSEASRLIAQIKRSVIFGATIHPYAQHVRDERGIDIGVAETVKVAVLKDMPALARNYIGEEASNDSMDGSGLSHPLQARYENNSLIDNRVGYNKKSIHGDVDPKYGVQKLLKWAVYGITNEVRRNSKGSKASMEKIYKKMSDKTFTMNQQSLIDAIIKATKNQPVFFYNEETGTVTKRFNFRNNGDSISYQEEIYYEVAQGDGITYLLQSGGSNSAMPKNLYEVDLLYGGAWSCDEIIPGATVKGPTFNERNLDMLEEFVSVNSLKDHFIAYVVNKSAMKTGIGNMNSEDAWMNDEALKTINMSTKYSGIQMDADHELDMAEVTEMTQMLSALIEDGRYVDLVEEIYNIIGKTVFEQLGDIKQAVDSNDRNSLYKILAKALIESFNGDDKDTLGLAQAFVRKAQAHLNDSDITYVLPFSAQTINGAFISNLASSINKKGIRHKYQGFAGVLNPSYNEIQYFRVFNPNTNTYEVRLYKEFMALSRSLGMDFAKTQSNDPNENKFLVPYKNGKLDIDFEDTVVIYNTDANGNIISVAEEVYVNTYKKYDYLRHYYDWTNKVALNKTSAPKNLKQANTRFEIEVGGVKTVYSLYDTDWVRAQYYLRDLESDFGEKELDLKKASFILNLILSDENKLLLKNPDGTFNDSYIKSVITKNNFNAIRSTLQSKTQEFLKKLDNKETVVIPSFNGGGIGKCLNVWTTSPEIIAGRYHGKQFGLSKNDHIFDIVSKGPQFFYDKLSSRYEVPSKEIFGEFNDITLFHGDESFMVKVMSDEDSKAFIAAQSLDATISNDNDFRLVGDSYWNNNIRIAKEAGIKFYKVIKDGQVQHLIICENADVYSKLARNQFFDQYKEYNWTENNIDILKSIRFKNFNTARLYIEPESASDPDVVYVPVEDVTLEQLTISEIRSKASRLLEIAECQFEAFKQQLNYVGARIPTQAMQSFMPMEIIAFTDTDKNEVYVPAAQTWLQGSDYDIDKLYILAHSIDENGILQVTSNLTRSYPISLINHLSEPNGVDYKEGEENSFDVDYETLLTILKGRQGDLRTRFSTEAKQTFISTLNAIFASGKENIRFVGIPEGENLEKLNWLKHKFIQILNTHSKSVSNEMSSEDCLKNKIVAAIINITKSAQNQIAAHMPIDMTEQQNAAAKSVMGEAAKHMCSDNPLSKYIMQTQNMIGKEVIGITAVGLKGFFGLSTYYGMKIERAAKDSTPISYDPKANSWVGVEGISIGRDAKWHPVIANLNFEPLIEKALRQGLTEDSIEVKELRRLQKESRNRNIGSNKNENWVPIDVALSISGLLSAATDNAKELILAKINATPELADIYIYLLTKGWTFSQIAELMCSKAFTFATELGEKNIFDLGSTSYSVKKMIPFILGKDDLPGVRFDLIGGLLGLKSKNAIKKALEDPKRLEEIIQKISETLESIDKKKQNLRHMDEEQLEAWREAQENYNEYFNSGMEEDEESGENDNIATESTSNMFESDLILVLGQVNMYLKKANFVNANKDLKALATINSYLNAVKEMSLVGQTFGINQGIKTNVRDFLNFADRINSTITTNFKNYGKSLPKGTPDDVRNSWKELKFDFLRFLKDESYRESMINNYQQAKVDFNVLEAITTVPHFSEMLKAYGMAHDTLATVCSKFRVMENINRMLKEERVFATEKDFKEIGNYVNDLYIHNFFKKNNISFKIPVGQKYYLDIFGKYRINTDPEKTIRINTAQGAATFKNWVENYVIPTLKVSEEFGNEEFIKSLCTFETEYMGNTVTGYTLPLQMMDIDKSVNTQLIFEKILRSFDAIASKSFENGMSLGEIFYLYNLLVNKDGFGQRSLTRLFENLINSRSFTGTNIINRYYQYVGSTDFNFIGFDDPEANVDELIFRLRRYSSTFKGSSVVDYKRPNPDFTFDLPISTGWGEVKSIQNEKIYSIKPREYKIKLNSAEMVYTIAESIAERYNGSVEVINNRMLEELPIPNEAKNMSSFIYNGKVFINIDSADVLTSSLHEWAHLVFANMKYNSNEKIRNAYYNMLKKVSNDPKLKDSEFTALYEGFAQGSDFLEEVVTYHIATYLQNKIFKNSKVVELEDTSILKSLKEILGDADNSDITDAMLSDDTTFDNIIGDLCRNILTYSNNIAENIVLLSQQIAAHKAQLIKDGKLETKCK